MCVHLIFFMYLCFVCVMCKNTKLNLQYIYISFAGVIIGVLMEEEVPLGLEIIAKAIEQNSK